MVHLFDVVNENELKHSVTEGLVSARQHNEYPLTILNYTPACQFGRHWSETNKACRGLIYNHETMEVVARPFPKFFNWDESGSPYPPSGPALRMEKLDGSLGVLYSYPGESIEALGRVYQSYKYAIATRGSMHSEQAEWATDFFNSHIFLAQTVFLPKRNKTYLFEIIYPENRIVVDYGDYKGLVLLDVIDNITGFSDTDEFDNCNWEDKVKRHPVPGFDSGQTADIPEGEEGFVYLWPTRNFRTKMKSAEYIRIHRIVTGLSAKSIWEMLVAGKTPDQIKIDIPEEFHEFVDTEAGKIMKAASEIVTDVYRAIEEIQIKAGVPMDLMSRKSFALMAKEYGPLQKYLFLVLDGKQVYPVALRAVKPSNTSLVTEG